MFQLTTAIFVAAAPRASTAVEELSVALGAASHQYDVVGCGAVETTVTVDAGRVITLSGGVVVLVVVVVGSMAEDESVEVEEGTGTVDKDVSVEDGILVGDELEGGGGADDELLAEVEVDLVASVIGVVLVAAGDVAVSVAVGGREVGGSAASVVMTIVVGAGTGMTVLMMVLTTVVAAAEVPVELLPSTLTTE
ncbi:hypothetical protein H2201_001929 [Coniosporium apollinis]|uniref:Uncharacterized protein n=2 Tax=Coniosporium TaxID=2810619 RepID=A0ABQ9P5G9_9PEZI|nr:hypothetical protein H2199_000563 [Cladosporium sp. JES 115]KAJ9668123.1 hypothetical protein H2201_001929 [Coniosporium apollinis]